ncbi:MaoC/PaaZ C-terminal domain-containing protein [Propionicimonas sp.]|uniref:MaoC/PaaZ C-terminal domain-containing protein n=1 Tax=Propionicimonas sp. TaxID=1955623 RepID=UPI0017A2733A|nr:MaoC/PaaZ C-terminal domain-containing protein [Propionicimonas sp.]MBU3977712.1 MaoC family dehydratase N-terminal domain-containing protein [Actinomycetota bacterium]MBA3021635.1 dehydratase [Propionicimonas sp.]MBU3987186.1 MaoC family dehydratase N-terminal domain-containing protein [Actinomycetota bacterium]MBU4009007.1 MaoC family dehydratase N-terminal domain-containing protein [Actinomycetota bacterium]MBU4065843.1 MaoC family dehydratase N-terminal domain-containing protein [Actino
MSIQAEVGQSLGGFTATFTRESLARYAGASGDFNPIHYNDAAATALGLPGVIAHGMLTMGTALRVVTDWAGDPARVLSYYVRFTKPVVVPASGGVEVRFSATVTAISDQVATISIEATSAEVKVLGSATAEVRLD